MLPIIAMLELSILSLFYFGTGSALHWFLIDFIIYALAVFRSDQRVLKYGTALCTVSVFWVCEFMGAEKGLYLSAQDQKVALFLVFLCSSFAVAVIVSMVVNRLRTVNEHLRILTEKDELTGLSNRRKVLADADDIFADSIVQQDSCVFAIIDLDHFKRINDTYGHDAGDLVLVKVSETMAAVVRDQDEIGRYGEEEFIVIMRKVTLKQAEAVMERIRTAVENMFVETEQGIVIPVTISIGLSTMEPGVSRFEEVLAQASKALYVAKRNGRNRIAIESSFQD
ncbi:GGDEF domain-containing protein [Marinomonas transparens]|nr:GGDEF domain-containing protein [Marinomonas transparens]